MDKTFADYDRDVEKYSDATDFERYLRTFAGMNAATRIENLKYWDSLFEHETRPTREVAKRITQKRQLDDVHQLLVRNGR